MTRESTERAKVTGRGRGGEVEKGKEEEEEEEEEKGEGRRGEGEEGGGSILEKQNVLVIVIKIICSQQKRSGHRRRP